MINKIKGRIHKVGNRYGEYETDTTDGHTCLFMLDTGVYEYFKPEAIEGVAFRKKVLMPIEVSANDYCWDSVIICPHFDNEGGHATCSLGFYLKSDPNGDVPKPKECKELKNE